MVLKNVRFVDSLVFPSTSVTQSQNLDRPTIDDVEKKGEEEVKDAEACASLCSIAALSKMRARPHTGGRDKKPRLGS